MLMGRGGIPHLPCVSESAAAPHSKRVLEFVGQHATAIRAGCGGWSTLAMMFRLHMTRGSLQKDRASCMLGMKLGECLCDAQLDKDGKEVRCLGHVRH